MLRFFRRRKAERLLAEARAETQAAKNGDYARAAALLEQVIALDPDQTAVAAASLSAIARQRGDLREAIRQLMRAHGAQPDAVLLLAVAEIHRELGEHAEALAAFDQALQGKLVAQNRRRGVRGAALSASILRAPDAERRLLDALDGYSGDSEVWAALSRHYAAAGRPADAARALLPVIRADRDDVEAHWRLRTLAGGGGRLAPETQEPVGWPPDGVDETVLARLFDHRRSAEKREALALCGTLPQTAALAPLRALVSLRFGDVAEAKSCLGGAGETMLASYVRALLAIHEVREPDAARALEACHRAKAPFPSLPFLLGARREIAGDDAAAEALYREALDVDADDAETLLLLAGVLRRRGDFEESARAMRRAYLTDPALMAPGAQFRLHAISGRRQAAARARAETEFEAHPGPASAFALARACNEMRDYRRVLEIEAKEPLAVTAENAQLHRERGYARYALGDLAGAARELAAVFAAVPEDLECRLRLGEVLAQLERHAEAEPHLDAAIRGLPCAFHGPATRAILSSMRGEFARAEELYLAAMRIDPTQGEIHLNLAVDLSKRSQPERAVIELEYATILMPGDSKALLAYARALEEVGRKEEAVAAHNRALQLMQRDLTRRSLGTDLPGMDVPPPVPRAKETRRALERLARALFGETTQS